MLAPDTVLQNRYRVERLLAKGGMGAVYLARDQRLRSQVALKESFFANESLLLQFEREAQLLANLKHEALPRVIDHFAENEGRFLVMEFVPGDDLMQMLNSKGSAFSAAEILEWADQLLDALDYLHNQQPPVIHRDIKPQNIKLSPKGKVVLLDFGLAKGSTWQMSQATSGSIFGYTPDYAPIEQIKGTGTDSRSDLYSLGATLYHLLTGIRPVDALTRASAIVEEQADPLRSASEVNPHVPQAVADFLKKAMALNRERRPASAAEMRALLRQAGKHLADDAATIVGESPAAGMSDQKTVPAAGPATDAGQMAQAGTVAASAQTTGAIAEGRESRPWKRPASIGGALGAIVVAAIIGAQLWFSSPRSPSLIEQPLTPSQPATSPKPSSAESASSFDFEYVTIDSRGGIMNRRKGQAPLYIEDLGDGVKLEMVEIRGGTFMMGSPDTEVGRDGNEGPQRSVTVPTFYLGRYEVTQEQWREVASLPKVSRDLSPNPSNFKGDKSPVESVSWLDAVEFCERLSRIKAQEYRLPTEAEWEYACRAGTTTAFAFGETITPEVVNYDGRSPYALAPKGLYRQATAEAGSLRVANAFGLYDMHGNVFEWCRDVWRESYDGATTDGSAWEGGDGTYRVVRGGAWNYPGVNSRSANRDWINHAHRFNLTGFRVASSAKAR